MINGYRPPQGNVDNFIDKVIDNITYLSMNFPNAEIVLLGDFNLNTLDKNSAEAQNVKWLEQVTGLKQCISGVTRYSITNLCFDLLFTNMIENFTTDILDVNISDHQFIHLHRQHMPKTKTKMDFVGRSYKNYNKNTFCENLTRLDWNEYYACNNPNNAWKFMVNHIVYTLDKMCPLKGFKIAQEKEPWISNEILEIIKDKDRLLRRAKNGNTEQDWDIAKNCRNRTNYLIRQAQANFIKENLNNSQNNAKKFWQNIKDVLSNSKDIKTSKISLRNEHLNFIQYNKEMADSLNIYFTNIGPSLATNMHDPWHYTGNLIESVLEDDFS